MHHHMGYHMAGSSWTKGIYVIFWHSRPRMRLYKQTDLYIAFLFNTDFFQMSSLMPATAAKNKIQGNMIDYYSVNLEIVVE